MICENCQTELIEVIINKFYSCPNCNKKYIKKTEIKEVKK